MSEIDFNDYFYYDETSPSCLRWKVDRTGSNNRNFTKKGDVAGCLDKLHGYYRVSLYNVLLCAHRVVYSLFNGKLIKGLCIDHIDRNRSNNSIGNLREISYAENRRNSLLSTANRSGKTGVHLCQGKYWKATWVNSEGKGRNKCFSIRKYGAENAFKLACEYRLNAILSLNKGGANYSDSHGS